MRPASKVEHLRKLMKEQHIDAYVVPTEDPHQSEYVAEFEHRREFISGFTGSAGTAVVTQQEALLWTDGRYWLQADKELDLSVWRVMKDRLVSTPSVPDYLAHKLPEGAKVAIDPRLLAEATVNKYRESLKHKNQHLYFAKDNLIDKIWGEDRPAPPTSSISTHPVTYSGKSLEDKIHALRKEMKQAGALALVVSALDEVAWILNVRGADIAYNPVVISYVIVGIDYVQFFVDIKKVTTELKTHLGNTVTVLPYEAFFHELSSLDKDNKPVWIDPKSSAAIFDCVSERNRIAETTPIAMSKALKNDVELTGMTNCHLRDAAALIQFIAWLEEELVVKGNQELTEVSVSDVLESYRSKQADFVSLSFSTIAGSGANGAIIHYAPDAKTCAKVEKKQDVLS
eukprot:TRINITY_DN7409_c0_g2_i1.p1 TRINITY_DN7409_c0_g2~~TRINITY_DN7409_c0_g2_i1.p1  ORF type:complete len:434 (-),score=125.21 TRINITY_DN7409_c0_g2_i1:483-1679(-)